MKTLQDARIYAVKTYRTYATAISEGSVQFAGHVSDEQKTQIMKAEIKFAEEVEAGMHDFNFTIRQRIHYFLTGVELPLLP